MKNTGIFKCKSIDSTILTDKKNIELIHGWIGKDNIQLQLLTRATKDGFTHQVFINKCDN